MKNFALAVAVTAGMINLVACASSGSNTKDSPAPAAQAMKAPGTAAVGDKTMCPVSHKEFVVKADSPSVVHEGKTYYFCCPGCVDKFKAEPAKFLAAPAAAEAAAPAALPADAKAPGEAAVGDKTMCPVSHEVFVVKADSPSVVHEGKTYYFCCAECVEKFKGEPAKFLAH